MNRRRNLWRYGLCLAGLIGLMVGLGLVSGCRTISGGGVPSIEVTLTSDGNVLYGETLFPVNELASRLMSEGAGRQTAIFLVVPPGMTSSALAGLSHDLHQAGFLKIIFKRPRKPEATVHLKGASR